ncbi:MAG: response regulator [Candidatus Marinimicrobia bacterium]|nr:response regulator [Candidatus Neomarinimicrobiota bacterium]
MSKKILIIDDEVNISKLLAIPLKKMDFKIIEADNGLTGLELARTEAPDLIILDIMLPKLDGYKLCRLLKFDERYSNIPIVMLTAKSDEKDERLGLQMGADIYLTKPINLTEFREEIEKLVG